MTKKKPSGTWAPLPPPKNQAWENASAGRNLDNPRPYSPKEIFVLGDVIEHKSFGIGIVMGFKEGNKIIVVFKDTTRKLAQGAK
jgi:hypothetical protein